MKNNILSIMFGLCMASALMVGPVFQNTISFVISILCAAWCVLFLIANKERIL